MKRTRDWLKSSSSAPFAVQSGQLGTGVISSATVFAAGVVDAAAIGADAVGTSEIAASILPWSSGSIPCTKPAVVEMLGSTIPNKDVTIAAVRVRCGTLPTGATDAFSLNIKNGASDIFSADQVFAREPDVTAFLKTLDIAGGNDGTTWTSYLTEVTGAGTAALGGLNTLANGDAVFIGFLDPFAGLRVDMDGANVNAVVATLAVHFWDGTNWTAVGNLVDGTAAGGATLAQDGAITFDTPVGWRTKAINSVTRFWVRLTHNGAAALTAGTAVDNCDIVRDTNFAYTLTPDQNLTVTAGTLLSVNCTEVDANADKLEVEILGVVTT